MDPAVVPDARPIVDRLRQSRIYRDYEAAFREMTGLPLALEAPQVLDLPHRGNVNENPFCRMIATCNPACAACLRAHGELEREAQREPATTRCFAGLCDSAVPVRVGERLAGFLHTGQVMLQRPSSAQFRRTERQLDQWGASFDSNQLATAYFQTPVVTKRQYDAILRLLTIFAQQLSTLSNQLLICQETSESPVIARARAYLAEHHTEDVTLSDVSRAVNMSSFYFCKVFKRATGDTFTDYLARLRVETVKNLLLNPHKRVSEAAFQAGFQSLSQFNRVFQKIAGESPSRYRKRLARYST